MIDDLIKTLILELPNFVGLVAALYVITRFVLLPVLEAANKRNEQILQMLQDCMEAHLPAESMSSLRSKDFSNERSGTSPIEKSDNLT